MHLLIFSILSHLLQSVLAAPTSSHHETLYARQMVQRNASLIYNTRFENVTWDSANWIITTTSLDQGHYQARMSVANGYHGINVAALGPFFEVDTPVNGDNINGWPLFGTRQTFATVGGFWDSQPDTNASNYPWLYQYGWDSAISGIPHWSGIVVDLGGETYLDASTDSSTISNFVSSLDMKRGLMNWAFTWNPEGSGSFNISYQMFAHRLNITQGLVSMSITASSDTSLNVSDVLNGDCAVRSVPFDKGVDGDFIYTAVQPVGVTNVTAYIYSNLTASGAVVSAVQQGTLDRPYAGSNESSIASGMTVNLTAGQTATFYKFVGIASSDGFTEPQNVSRAAAQAVQSAGYPAALSSHAEEWSTTFLPTSVDDFSFPENGSLPDDPYMIEAAINAVTNPYYLLQNTIGRNAILALPNATVNSHSIAVGGLGSDSYAGQIFWDAEIWMQPGLVLTFPFASKGIAAYRVERHDQAIANAQTAYQSSKNDSTFSETAAIYPWTSGRYGNCTATGPCWDYEYHINGDIVMEFTNYWLSSGDTEYFQESLFPIINSIATMYSEVLRPNGSRWSLTNMTDPDEYANQVDNGGFTMPLIAEILRHTNTFRSYFNETPNATWTNQSLNVLIERDEEANIILEYSGMNGSINVKQADVVLTTFPLSYTGQNYSNEDSLSDLEYYAAKQSSDGPGMTYAMFSIIANQVYPSGCPAYTYQQHGSQPYARAPWFQFSEQLIDDFEVNGGYHPAYPFLTGHGGANQVAIFGYLGLRLQPSITDWSLHIDPSLPPQIPQIRYRTFHFHGWPIMAFSNQTHTTLTRSSDMVPASGTFPNETYATGAIPVIVGSPGSGTSMNFSLPPDGSIVVPNRQSHLIQMVPGNIAQCSPAMSDTEVLPGQFAIGAVDGAAFTKWQPALANETAYLTVTLEPGLPITEVIIDWGQAPAYNYSVIIHNASFADVFEASDAAPSQVILSERVNISYPFNETEILGVVPVRSNFTNATLSSDDEIVSARYATLSIWGSLYNGTLTAQNMSGDGATVAEWNLVGPSTQNVERRGIIADPVMKRQLEVLDSYNQARHVGRNRR